ncbi:hypothetical protein [Bradyrhizobium sp. RDT46]|uniref:hypothetical protein n=1 Tax=Bradyrhizobium sp. RDT46 TaxID=3341829 RepID=UPI0035C675E7
MRGIVVAVALLEMANALQARETDFPRGEVRSSAAPVRQLATSSGAASRTDTEKPRRNERKSADFSAERIVPDICTGC